MLCKIRGIDFEWGNARQNFILADNWSEIFFGIVQIDTPNGSFITEKLESSEHDNAVLLDIVVNGFEYKSVPFVLVQRGKDDGEMPIVCINENLLTSPQTPKPVYKETAPEFLVETVKEIEKKVEEQVDVSSIIQINELKKEALHEIQKQRQSLERDVESVTKAEHIIDEKFDAYKQSLLEQFYANVDQALTTFKETADAHIVGLSKTVANDIVNACLPELQKSVDSASETINEKAIAAVSSSLDLYRRNVDTIIQESADTIEGKLELSIIEKINKAQESIADLAEQTRDQVNRLVAEARETIFDVDKKSIEKASEDIVQKFLKIEELIKEVEEKTTIVNEKIEKIDNPSEQDLIKDADRFLNALALDNKTTIDNRLAQFEETVKSKLEAISLDSLYTKFNEQHGPKVEKAVEELLEAKKTPSKFKFFKDKAVKQEFEQLVYTALLKKEADWIRQVKKIVMDFYYSWGSGGGSGNVTINQGTSGGGGPTTDPYKIIATSGLTGVSAVVDTYSVALFKTAKYTIEVLSGAEMYSSEISVLGNASTARLTEYAILCTVDPAFISYQAVSDGANVLLIAIAQSNLLNMTFQGIRIDPILS